MADRAQPDTEQARAGTVTDVPPAENPSVGTTEGAASPAGETSASINPTELDQSDMDALLDGAAAADLQTASVSASASEGIDPSTFPTEDPALDTRPFELPDLADSLGSGVEPHRVSMLHDVNLRVRVELGRTRMRVEDVLKLGEGSIVELEKLAGDPVDVYVNDRLLARGEVLVLNDSFCVRVSEVFTPDPHRIAT